MPLVRVARRCWRLVSDHILVLAIILAIALVTLAALPSATQAADGEHLLVADLRGSALVILDPTRPEAARRIAVPGGPHELLRLPDGRVAVSLEQAGTIAVVDLESGEVETLSTGGLPHGLALQRDADSDRLLVTDREHDTVRRFVIGGAASTWREVSAVHASGWPHAVVTRGDGTMAVVRASDAVLQIDGREVGVSSLPETVALSPDQARVATAGATGGAVHIVGWDGTGRVDAAVGGRPVRTIFSHDGTLVAAALSATSSVALVDREGGVRTVSVVGTPDGLAFSANGTLLYAADMAGGRVTVVEVASGRTLAVISVGISAGSLLVLPAAK
jgi:DNA-binding beta-propeller fold protein YncE